MDTTHGAAFSDVGSPGGYSAQAEAAVALKATGVHKSFGGVAAVDGLSMEVSSGQIHSLVGPNGSGKSTLFALISGLEPVDRGSIAFEGHELTRLPAAARAHLGIGRAFQSPRLFSGMTALENVLVALEQRYPLRQAMMKRRQSIQRAEELLHDLQLYEKRHLLPNQLSYGEQKRTDFARALAQDPKLLLLDEPMAGLHAEEIAAIMERISKLREVGKTILLIEHNMKAVVGISDWVTVLNFGRKIAEGKPLDMMRSPAVVEAYLGSKALVGEQ